MGTQVQRSHLVHAPIAAVWAAISSMRAVEDWHPNVAAVSVLSEGDTGVGASRRVSFHDGNSVVETVVEVSAEQFVTMAMSEMPMMKHASVTIRVEPHSATTTEVSFEIDYQMGLGPLGWLMSAVMMKGMFRKVFGVALGGLAYHLETGERVTARAA
jgi:ribosome-associated toxin RatA of RatAB toxin-antitoxin module